MAFAKHDEIMALGREPIEADRPVGDPCRYDEAFEELQAQLDRIGSLTGEEVEWPKVVELAADILKSKSKDLLVMTYLVLGLFEQHGYAALVTGLEAYGEFLHTFWEKCFPKVKPPQGRYNAVQYLADRILPRVELKGGKCKREPGANEKEAVHQCAEQMDKLVTAVDEVFKGQSESPNLMPLKRAFQALKQKVGPLTAPAPEGAAAEPAAAGAPAPAGVAAPETFTSPTQAAQVVIKVAKFLLSQNNKDARAYQLMRAVHFGGLSVAPKDGLLPPIPPQRRTFFEKLAGDGNWPDLLTEAEGQFATTPLWLDLQRYVAVALKGLGPAYNAACKAVAAETVALQARLPELFDLTFKGHTPFADGATKAWLDEASGEIGGGGGGSGAGGHDALSEALGEARKLLSESKHADAVARLATAIDTSPDRRQRFRSQLALARLLMDMNRFNLATALLEELDSQIEQFQLGQWEPELAADVVGRLYECLRKSKAKPTPDDVKRSSQLFARLCRLDPQAALKLDGASGQK